MTQKHSILLLTLFFHLGLFSQDLIQEYSIAVDETKSYSYSKEISIVDNFADHYSFLGISAFHFDPVESANIVLECSYKNGDLITYPLTQIHEGYMPDRISYVAPLISKAPRSIKIKIENAHVAQIKLRLFYAQKTSDNDRPIIQKSNACEMPDYCNRSCWCPQGDCPVDTTPENTEPTHIIVHHSAGHNDNDDYPAVVRFYWDLHVNTNGWDDIGYNWLIDQNGVIYEGRGAGLQGAHFSCMNRKTIGICMIGDFTVLPPSTNAIDKLIEFIAALATDNKLEIKASNYHENSESYLQTISGHKDGNGLPNGCSTTVCPGSFLYELLPFIRNQSNDSDCYNDASDQLISMLDHVPSVVNVNEQVDFFATISNLGMQNAENVEIEFQLDEEPIGTDLISAISSNSTLTTGIVYSGFSFGGTYELCAVSIAAENEYILSNNTVCKSIVVDGPTSTYEIESDSKVFYPNPANHKIFFNADLNLNQEISIFGIDGIKVLQDVLTSNEFDISKLNAGTYLVKIYDLESESLQILLKY